MITECNRIRYKEAGYDYFVTYKEWKESFGDYVRAGFPTTQDALQTHIKTLKKNPQDIVQLEIISL